MARVNKKLVKEALKYTKGAVYLAAKRLGCSHTTIYDYINKYDDIREIKEYYEEELNDIAELKLRESVMHGEPWSIKYQLSTKGKERGYVEKTQQELSTKDDKPIPVKIIKGVSFDDL